MKGWPGGEGVVGGDRDIIGADDVRLGKEGRPAGAGRGVTSGS